MPADKKLNEDTIKIILVAYYQKVVIQENACSAALKIPEYQYPLKDGI